MSWLGHSPTRILLIYPDIYTLRVDPKKRTDKIWPCPAYFFFKKIGYLTILALTASLMSSSSMKYTGPSNAGTPLMHGSHRAGTPVSQ
jgi:hypothetical protein